MFRYPLGLGMPSGHLMGLAHAVHVKCAREGIIQYQIIQFQMTHIKVFVGSWDAIKASSGS